MAFDVLLTHDAAYDLEELFEYIALDQKYIEPEILKRFTAKLNRFTK